MPVYINVHRTKIHAATYAWYVTSMNRTSVIPLPSPIHEAAAAVVTHDDSGGRQQHKRSNEEPGEQDPVAATK